MSSTKTIPLPLIDLPWAETLGCKTPYNLKEMVLALFDQRLPGEAIEVRLPEAIGTMIDAPYTFRFVLGQKWQMSEDEQWGYDGANLQSFNSHKQPAAFNGEVSCSTTLEDARLVATLTLRNGSFSTWKSPYLWVCVMYTMAPSINPQTLVSVDGQWMNYEQLMESFHGPAGMRLLTQQGLKEIQRLEQEGYEVYCPFQRDLLVDGSRAACRLSQKEPLSVVVRCEDAVLIGGYDKNPCTDIAIGFGDLHPGQRKSIQIEVSIEQGIINA